MSISALSLVRSVVESYRHPRHSALASRSRRARRQRAKQVAGAVLWNALSLTCLVFAFFMLARCQNERRYVWPHEGMALEGVALYGFIPLLCFMGFFMSRDVRLEKVYDYKRTAHKAYQAAWIREKRWLYASYAVLILAMLPLAVEWATRVRIDSYYTYHSPQEVAPADLRLWHFLLLAGGVGAYLWLHVRGDAALKAVRQLDRAR